MEEISDQRGLAPCCRSLFNCVNAKLPFKLFPLQGPYPQSFAWGCWASSPTWCSQILWSFYSFYYRQLVALSLQPSVPALLGFFPFSARKTASCPVCRERGDGDCGLWLLSILFLSSLLAHSGSMDVIIAFPKLPWNISSEAFSFLMISITRRALEVSTRLGLSQRCTWEAFAAGFVYFHSKVQGERDFACIGIDWGPVINLFSL